MKGRRTAILSRREQEAEARRNTIRPDSSPVSPAEANGINSSRPVRSIEVSHSPPVGFTAVNLRQSAGEQDRRLSGALPDAPKTPGDDQYGSSGTGNVTILNGKSIKDASPSVRAEMMKKFLTPNEREAGLTEDTVRRSSMGGTARTNAMRASSAEKPRSHSIELSGGSSSGKNPPSVAIPNTPASLMPHLKPTTFEKDDGGPFKTEMVRRMDNMWKGDRVIPPCDRCRRLHMDCLKNLTACMGCTKKHAKCSWKEVKASELHLTAQSTSPEREAATGASVPEQAPPLSAGSTIEVNRPPDEVLRSASLAPASLDLTGDKHETEREPKTSRDDAEQVTAGDANGNPEAAPLRNSSARFDVRPPPLVQQSQSHEAADRRSPAGPNPFVSPFSPYEKEKDDDDDDADGDRLQALAARVYRTASQSGQRSQ